jgi:alkylation response protein AidB-like acyl-CoA dehydrogenase
MRQSNWKDEIDRLGNGFRNRAAGYDESDAFVAANWEELKAAKLFSAMVPVELGGGGLSHSDMCRLIREMSSYCSSTALAFSMHQHLVAAAVWNYRHGRPGEKLLRRVADDESVLVSTGANDWLESSGTLEPCDGGFRFSGSKAFSSGCPGGDLLLTSGRYNDPAQGWQVLHFPLSLRAEGVRIGDNWRGMGMRGTGSHTVSLENVFIPAEAIGVRRPMGKYHQLWDIVLTVALPLISAAYVGIADAAATIARRSAARQRDDLTATLVGELTNEFTTAALALDDMIALANDFDFEPSVALTNEILIRKTIATQAVIRTTSKALEVAGGAGYLRPFGIERLIRDAYAGQFHPLTPKRQHLFTGRVAMGLQVDDRAPASDNQHAEALPGSNRETDRVQIVNDCPG